MSRYETHVGRGALLSYLGKKRVVDGFSLRVKKDERVAGKDREQQTVHRQEVLVWVGEMSIPGFHENWHTGIR